MTISRNNYWSDSPHLWISPNRIATQLFFYSAVLFVIHFKKSLLKTQGKYSEQASTNNVVPYFERQTSLPNLLDGLNERLQHTYSLKEGRLNRQKKLFIDKSINAILIIIQIAKLFVLWDHRTIYNISLWRKLIET